MIKTISNPAYDRLISRLRQRRRDLNLKQEDVARRLGVCRTWIGKMEQKERRLDVVELYRLCQVYGLPWTDMEDILREHP
jgi:transcriptional regulator with XRE-family HTH domain